MINTIIQDMQISLSHPWILIFVAAFLGQAIYTDIKQRKIYRNASFIFMAVRVAIEPFFFQLSSTHIIGALIGFFVPLLVALLFKGKSIGGGDIFFKTAIGLWLGTWAVIIMMFFGSLFAIIAFVAKNLKDASVIKDASRQFEINLITRTHFESEDTRMPMAPYLSGALIAAIIMFYILR